MLITFVVIAAGVTSFYTFVGLNELFDGATDDTVVRKSASTPIAPSRAPSTPTTEATVQPVRAPAGLIRGSSVTAEGWGVVTLHTLEVGIPRFPGDPAAAASGSLTIADVEACVADLVVRLQPSAFYLQLADNARITPDIDAPARAPALGEAALFGGDCVRGYLTFEIPDGRQLRSFNFEMTNPLTGEIQRVWWTIQP